MSEKFKQYKVKEFINISSNVIMEYLKHTEKFRQSKLFYKF